MRLLLCDDHPIVAIALRSLFEAHGHEVVGVVGSPEGLPIAVTAYRPDVCVIDLYYDDGLGAEPALAAIRACAVATDVVVVSGRVDAENRRTALAAGAAAVVDKSQVGEALVAVVEGRSARAEVAAVALVPPNPHRLTGRELQVLQHLTDGHTTARMAVRLDTAEATVRSHVQSVLTKLDVHTRSAAVAVAVREGLVTATA